MVPTQLIGMKMSPDRHFEVERAEPVGHLDLTFTVADESRRFVLSLLQRFASERPYRALNQLTIGSKQMGISVDIPLEWLEGILGQLDVLVERGLVQECEINKEVVLTNG